MFLTGSMFWFLLAIWEARTTPPPAGSCTDQLRDSNVILNISSVGVLQGVKRKGHLETGGSMAGSGR